MGPTVNVQHRHSIDDFDFHAEDPHAFMYRTIRKDQPDRVYVAAPMFTTDSTTDSKKRQHRHAYGVRSYINHKLQPERQLLASEPTVIMILNLRKNGTAVSVGNADTATTYKLIDATNAMLYARAVDKGGNTLEEMWKDIESDYYRTTPLS